MLSTNTGVLKSSSQSITYPVTLDSSGRFRHKRKALSRWNISYVRNNLTVNLFDIHQTLQKERQSHGSGGV